ncbi:MAG: type III polyketide synthase [Candidatus Latescibacteria bacterium]|nr:type III polyketide synthase [Candidatus Latescibacterota bacterium]
MIRQADVKRLATRLFSTALDPGERLLEVFDNAEIETRHACVPLEWLSRPHTFGEQNDLYIEHAARLGTEVAGTALERAGLSPRDVDHVVFVSSTGVATPSIDARLCNRLDLRVDVRRTPIWGLGCAGGAAGLSRARDFALADPSARVLLVALELCSLAFQPGDVSKRNLVAASLFGDGAAAAVVVGSSVVARSAPPRALELVSSQSILWKNTLDVMGWTIDGDGLHVVFSRDIPSIVRENVRPSLAAFLDRNDLALDDVEHLVTHPGGVKVLRAYAEALGLAPERFRHAHDVLRAYGNMSSPSCLFVLERYLAAKEIAHGERAVVSALGPGFSAEYVLLRGLA